MNRLEWRQLNDVELAALGTFWKSLGEAMEIPYNFLKSNNDRWTDGVQWLESLEQWSIAYEQEHIVPEKCNARLAEETLGVRLRSLPGPLRRMARQFMSVLLGNRLRGAMLFERPPRSYFYVISVFWVIRRFVIKHCCLPRPYFLRHKWLADKPDPTTGKFQVLKWKVLPYYIKPTFANRWGYRAILTRCKGGVLPRESGDK